MGAWPLAAAASGPPHGGPTARSSGDPATAAGAARTHWHQVVADEDVPRSVLHDFPSAGGAPPAPRWGHAAAAVGDRLFVFGGVGASVYDDAFCYDAARGTWRAVVPAGNSRREAPPAMFGAAAAAFRQRVVLFGGRQGRKYIRRTYVLDTETMLWRCLKELPNSPPACAGHTMTGAGRHGVLAFGGAGKKCSGALHRFHPCTLAWEPLAASGAAPPPRHGHSAVWDSRDALVVYGGTNGAAVFSDVRVLCLTTGRWEAPACEGAVPLPRYGHSAAMVAANLMLVFGGCDGQGAFLNDTYLLNTVTWRWHALAPVGSPPAARHAHVCAVAAGRTLVHGGSNAAQSFDGVVVVFTDFGRELNSMAAELVRLADGSQSSAGAAAAADQDAGNLEAAAAGVPQSLPYGTAPAAAAAAAGAAPVDSMQVQLADLLRRRAAADAQALALRKAEIAEGLFRQERLRAQELQAQVHELRLLREEEAAAAALARDAVAEEAAALRRARAADAQRAEQAEQRVEALQELLRERDARLARAAGARAQLQLQRQQPAAEERCSTLEEQLREQTVRATAAEANLHAATERGRQQDVVYMQLAAKLRECEQQLAMLRVAAACLRGDDSALRSCTLPQLHSLEDAMEAAWRRVRGAAATAAASTLARREAELAQRERAVEDRSQCALCMDAPRELAFNCGHQTCAGCGATLQQCPFCRADIQTRITLFK
ncbi:hypothetical protein WJX81_005504 [Elliptochloris bilobata]|uniref:RING-type domain-containing protein n=1 Tax=Elliptochloris bilobata TaxID=381761 RepID=A0AAW1RKV4_9CHLO